VTDPHDPGFITTLAADLMADPELEPTIGAILDRAQVAAPETDHASLVLAQRRGWRSLGASSDVAGKADALQEELGEGPAHLLDGAGWCRSGDVAADPRWVEWGPSAAAMGVGSVLSLRLDLRASGAGSLNLYSTASGRFGDRDAVDLARMFAVHAANALRSAMLVADLRTALESRHRIGLAQGILVERLGLDTDAAFAVLRRRSSETNIKLRDVATHLISRGRLP
jgi:hypothetical protein